MQPKSVLTRVIENKAQADFVSLYACVTALNTCTTRAAAGRYLQIEFGKRREIIKLFKYYLDPTTFNLGRADAAAETWDKDLAAFYLRWKFRIAELGAADMLTIQKALKLATGEDVAIAPMPEAWGKGFWPFRLVAFAADARAKTVGFEMEGPTGQRMGVTVLVDCDDTRAFLKHLIGLGITLELPNRLLPQITWITEKLWA